MKSLSQGAREKIEGAVDTLFDKVMYNFLGPFGKKKTILFSSKGPDSTLAHLFVQSLRNREPTPPEKDMLKGLISTASNYITALRDRTRSNIVDKLDAQVKSGEKLNKDGIQKIVTAEMLKSKKHMKLIAEAETTKTRNTGSAMDILKVGEAIGTSDPYCYFVVVHDDKLCKFCKQNHLLSDGITPKIFKFSEISHGYLSQDDRKAGKISTCGQHPICRCTLVMLSPGFGFINGKVTWIGIGHNEYDRQKNLSTK